MATDHYTRLGIKKEKFYELDEKEKKELVDKQFRGLAGSLFSKLLSIFFPGLAEKRLIKLKEAMDILKKDDTKANLTVDYNNNQSQEAIKNNSTKPLNLEEKIEQKKKELEEIKDGRETQKYDVTNKIIEHLESELKGLMERVLEIKAAKINDLNLKLEGTKGRDNRNNIKSDIVQIANERSKLLKELNDLDSKQPKKEVGQQDELTNIPPKFTNVSTEKNLEVLKEQFKKGLEKIGIDIKGMGHKEVLEKLKDNFLLNAQYEMIKKFEGKSEQPEQEKSEQQAKSGAKKGVSNKAVRIPLTKNVQKLVSNASEEGINFAQRELNRTGEASEQQKGNGRSI
ncbi:hypothetical protein [Candidatus Mesenet endosymbiont of Agriotes lineatus]|uniref:hypothetical protein n=1 Tax=Candidatus Mesenet endosymbiont of Agriotes lineatus TaxID=3077948 RepID=UPI0030CEA744